jgi:crossover junction endodeoxyribonuclease RuvC
MTKILAFDPGSQITGWAVLSCEPLAYEGSGVFKLGQGDFFKRMSLLKTSVEDLLAQFNPSILVLEKAFVGINKESALKLAQIRGGLLALCLHPELSYHEYSPRQAKQVITGYGAASKEQVAIMIEKLLKRSFSKQLDETDALALAMCHYFCHKRDFLFAQSRV